MKIQNNKRLKTVSTLTVLGLGLMFGNISLGNARADNTNNANNSEAVVSEQMRVSKPVAGRNRRRQKSAVSISAYPKANADSIRVSRHLNKLRINVLSNDSGHKLKVVDINPRSASGAQVLLRNGMAVYQVPKYFVGKDSFWYTMQDNSGRQHSAKVIVCICDR